MHCIKRVCDTGEYSIQNWQIPPYVATYPPTWWSSWRLWQAAIFLDQFYVTFLGARETFFRRLWHFSRNPSSSPPPWSLIQASRRVDVYHLPSSYYHSQHLEPLLWPMPKCKSKKEDPAWLSTRLLLVHQTIPQMLQMLPLLKSIHRRRSFFCPHFWELSKNILMGDWWNIE